MAEPSAEDGGNTMVSDERRRAPWLALVAGPGGRAAVVLAAAGLAAALAAVIGRKPALWWPGIALLGAAALCALLPRLRTADRDSGAGRRRIALGLVAGLAGLAVVGTLGWRAPGLPESAIGVDGRAFAVVDGGVLTAERESRDPDPSAAEETTLTLRRYEAGSEDPTWTREETWTPEDPGIAAPLVRDGVILLTREESLEAVDAVTGDSLWRHSTTGQTYLRTVADGLIAEVTDRRLVVRDLRTGSVRWRATGSFPSLAGIEPGVDDFLGTPSVPLVAESVAGPRTLFRALDSGRVVVRVPGKVDRYTVHDDAVVTLGSTARRYPIDPDDDGWRRGGSFDFANAFRAVAVGDALIGWGVDDDSVQILDLRTGAVSSRPVPAGWDTGSTLVPGGWVLLRQGGDYALWDPRSDERRDLSGQPDLQFFSRLGEVPIRASRETTVGRRYAEFTVIGDDGSLRQLDLPWREEATRVLVDAGDGATYLTADDAVVPLE